MRYSQLFWRKMWLINHIWHFFSITRAIVCVVVKFFLTFHLPLQKIKSLKRQFWCQMETNFIFKNIKNTHTQTFLIFQWKFSSPLFIFHHHKLFAPTRRSSQIFLKHRVTLIFGNKITFPKSIQLIFNH